MPGARRRRPDRAGGPSAADLADLGTSADRAITLTGRCAAPTTQLGLAANRRRRAPRSCRTTAGRRRRQGAARQTAPSSAARARPDSPRARSARPAPVRAATTTKAPATVRGSARIATWRACRTRGQRVISDVVSTSLAVVRLDRDLPMPSRAHDGDAGVDLCSALDVELAPGQRALVPTGIAVAIPHGMVGLVHPRSGLAARVGLSIVNSPGTIDAGYRGVRSG